MVAQIAPFFGLLWEYKEIIMPLDRFLIAPIQGGLETDVKPWLITDDAFARLENAYIFRGRVRKRFGSRNMNDGVAQSVAQLSSRVRINIGNTPGPINLPNGASQLKVGQMFSVGTDMFTVTTLGAAALTLSTNAGATATINSTSNPNTVIFTGEAAATAIYYYPSTPIMGFITYQTADSGNDPVYVFDTQFSYQFTSGAFQRLGTAIWTGTDSNFFWGTTWGINAGTRLLFVVNNNPTDRIKYWDGSTWTTIHPTINSVGPSTIESALMVVVFKNRLVMLSTWESLNDASAVNYTNRARWSAFGDPLQANGWDQSVPGKGNAIDASTMEDIISCGFIKDRLIVYFERSTWELVFTNNQAQPFAWQKLNAELGAESTFSAVPFDRSLLAIGNVGIHACNGVNTERIDNKIPDSVWEIHDGSNSVRRVWGIRDFYAEQVYWTFPTIDTDASSSTYPSKVLVFNYKTRSWALNDDSITAFGYYYAANESAITWDDLEVTWDNDEITWDSGAAQPLNQEIIAGNQEGFVFIVDSNLSTNAQSLQITNLTLVGGNVTVTAVNHNLSVQDYLYLQNLNGLTGPFLGVYQVISVTNSNVFVILAPDIYGVLLASQVYTGGGTLSLVSRIDILTKQFNFYVDQDRNATVQRVDFLVERTDSGEFTVDYLASTSNNGLLSSAQSNGSLLGTGVVETSAYDLYPFEAQQDRLWHPSYLMADGEAIQLRIYLTDEQMSVFNVVTSGFQMHAFCIYTQPTSQRLQ